MNDEIKVTVPIWFWVVAIIALLWNLMGLLAFVAQMMMTDEMLASLPQDQQAIYKNIPIWVTCCFAIAVIAGVLGSLMLLIRQKLAVACLLFSLVGVIGQYGHMFFMTETLKVMGKGAIVLPSVVVVVAILLVPFSMSCQRKGILK